MDFVSEDGCVLFILNVLSQTYSSICLSMAPTVCGLKIFLDKSLSIYSGNLKPLEILPALIVDLIRVMANWQLSLCHFQFPHVPFLIADDKDPIHSSKMFPHGSNSGFV